MREVYAYYFKDVVGSEENKIVNITSDIPDTVTIDDIREQAIEFLSDYSPFGDQAYIDKWGIVHEIARKGEEKKDEPFIFYFEVIDGYWGDVTGITGQYLDDQDEYNADMPENIRQGIYEVYSYANRRFNY